MMAYIRKDELVRRVQPILRGYGVDISQDKISKAFPEKAGSRVLFVLWRHMVSGRTYKARAILKLRLPGLFSSPEEDPKSLESQNFPESEDNGRESWHSSPEGWLPYELSAPKLGRLDCPRCYYPDARLAVRCPNCELEW